VEEVSAVAARHLGRGDRVGIVIYASRGRAWIVPAGGPTQAGLIVGALSGCSSMVDADRGELDELEVAQRVAEHLRPLAREHLWEHPTSDLDRLAQLAETVRARAPFEARLPHASSVREKTLRHYLACFGMEVPPRTEGERARADSELARTLTKLSQQKPRPSIISVWAPAPPAHGLVARCIRTLRARRVEIRWTLPEVLPSIGTAGGVAGGARDRAVLHSVEEAVRVRVRAEQTRGTALLRLLGVQPGARVTRPLPDDRIHVTASDDVLVVPGVET
jgi:hypothetical protein